MPYNTYKNKSLKTYLDDLAARKPAPGGGSAAALTGALGCALLSMACNFTIGKEKYKSAEKEIKKILKQAETLRKRFLALVDLDVQAYEKVSRSRKAQHKIYQKNLISAARVPLEICALAAEGHKFCPRLARIANEYLISDCLAAGELLKSCFKSASFNVIINLRFIKDKKFVSHARKIIADLKNSL